MTTERKFEEFGAQPFLDPYDFLLTFQVGVIDLDKAPILSDMNGFYGI